jgi:hypothetical protein
VLAAVLLLVVLVGVVMVWMDVALGACKSNPICYPAHLT